ncbi:MAG: hypothetical protein P1U63_04500 [Coxiellaceae bacterium]|nr:hypothetical protein [Coxiellaceae bacterium]
MKNLIKAVVAASCLVFGVSALANVMTASRQLDGGTVSPNGSEFHLMLSGKILERVTYYVNCTVNNPSQDPVMLQVKGVSLYDTHGMYISQVSVNANGQYAANQFALQAGDNKVKISPVGIRKDARGFLSLRNLDDTIAVTVNNCVASPTA